MTGVSFLSLVLILAGFGVALAGVQNHQQLYTLSPQEMFTHTFSHHHNSVGISVLPTQDDPGQEEEDRPSHEVKGQDERPGVSSLAQKGSGRVNGHFIKFLWAGFGISIFLILFLITLLVDPSQVSLDNGGSGWNSMFRSNSDRNFVQILHTIEDFEHFANVRSKDGRG